MVTVDDALVAPALHGLLNGDATELTVTISADPEIANASWNGNTLLEWSVHGTYQATGVEGGCRATRTVDRVRVTRLLSEPEGLTATVGVMTNLKLDC